VAITNALQLEAARTCVSRSGLFGPNLYCACAHIAVFQLLIKILTSPFNSATPISLKI